MWALDLLKKRSVSFQMNAVLLASCFSVGFTKCYLLPGHPGWEGYLACFFVGYVASILVAIFAGVFSAYLLGLDAMRDRDMLMIIAGMTLIIASLLFLLGSFGGFEDID
jgi:hypothetical protein